MILTPLQKLPKNVRDLDKLIVAKGLKNLPKVKNRPIWPLLQPAINDIVLYDSNIM